ncbi:MAG: J domain-containing protein [Maricaulaceae bacterium]
MSFLLLGLGLLVFLILGARAFASAPAAVIARTIRPIGGSILMLVGVVLSLRGLAMIGGPMALAGAGIIWPQLVGRGAGPKPPGATSQIDTPSVAMTLDHDTGAMDGEVRRGPRKGDRLSDLSLAEVRALWAMAAGDDADGAAILEAYVRRRFGDEAARDDAPPEGPPPAGAMTDADARALLGVKADATRDEIQAAYRRLMKLAHPDQGGSTGLAAAINRARATLLGEGD